MRRRARRSRPVAKPSSVNGGSSIAPSPTAWKKRASGSSPSLGCRRANGGACAPPTRSSGCMRNSNVGSRRRPCCPRRTPRPCCSGHCSLRDRSTCARSMVGRRSPPNQSIGQLTSLLDQIASRCRRLRRFNSNHIPDGTMRAAIVDNGLLVAFLDRAEQNHRWVAARIEDLDPHLLVCEPVLAEAAAQALSSLLKLLYAAG